MSATLQRVPESGGMRLASTASSRPEASLASSAARASTGLLGLPRSLALWPKKWNNSLTFTRTSCAPRRHDRCQRCLHGRFAVLDGNLPCVMELKKSGRDTPLWALLEGLTYCAIVEANADDIASEVAGSRPCRRLGQGKEHAALTSLGRLVRTRRARRAHRRRRPGGVVVDQHDARRVGLSSSEYGRDWPPERHRSGGRAAAHDQRPGTLDLDELGGHYMVAGQQRHRRPGLDEQDSEHCACVDVTSPGSSRTARSDDWISTL